MTVQLYEGCWGVTRGGEVRGPIGWVSDDSGSDRWANPPYARGLWNNEGSYGFALTGPRLDKKDIIAVFATEAEADAWLAALGQANVHNCADVSKLKINKDDAKPLGQILREECDRLIAKDKDVAPRPAPWPDGVTSVRIGPHQISLSGADQIHVDCPGAGGASPDQARQIAALLIAAADYVEGGEG